MEIKIGDVIQVINSNNQELYLVLNINNKQRIYASKMKEALTDDDIFYLQIPNCKYYFEFGHYFQTHTNKVIKCDIQLFNSSYIISEIRKQKEHFKNEITNERKKLKSRKKASNRLYKEKKLEENQKNKGMEESYEKIDYSKQKPYSKTAGLHDPIYKGRVKEIRG